MNILFLNIQQLIWIILPDKYIILDRKIKTWEYFTSESSLRGVNHKANKVTFSLSYALIAK